MTAEIIRHRREPSGGIIEARYRPFQFSSPKAANENRHLASSGMSPRETEIITHLATGKGPAAVADLVEMDEAAVKEHIRFILRKLKTRTTPSPSGGPVGK